MERGPGEGGVGRTGNRLQLPAEFGGWTVISTGLVGSSSKGLFKEKDYTLVAQDPERLLAGVSSRAES